MLTEDDHNRVRQIARRLATDGDHGDTEAGTLYDLLRSDRELESLRREHVELSTRLTRTHHLLQQLTDVIASASDAGLAPGRVEQLRVILVAGLEETQLSPPSHGTEH